MTLDYTVINGVRTAFRFDGPADAPVVLFSNSLAADIGMWDPQVARLGERYRCLRYDTRGHGRSDAVPGEYSIRLLAEDVVALLDALRLDKIHFIGLSLGGMIGQHLGAMYGDCLASLTLCATSSAVASDVWPQRIEQARREGMAPLVEPTVGRWFTEPFRQRCPDVVDRVRRMIAGTSVDGYAGCAAAIRDMHLSPLLGRIKVPTMVVSGEADAAMPPLAGEMLHAGIGGSEFVVIQDAAHLLNVEQPQAFNAVVSNFLARHRHTPSSDACGVEAVAH